MVAGVWLSLFFLLLLHFAALPFMNDAAVCLSNRAGLVVIDGEQKEPLENETEKEQSAYQLHQTKEHRTNFNRTH